MRIYDIIEKKKRGEALTREEIFHFVSGFTNGDIPDYQASALLMAIYFRGMSDAETVLLTEAIEDSGERLDLSEFGDTTVDKHSTGGVGDKTTLIVAPIAACLGATVAKMSGRGLGHTGGTVDKLESISGFRTELTPEEFRRQVKEIGISVISQSGNLAPADKKIYALRDVTATVDSIPLIASSIMGKKLATSTRSLVLDVKYGDGAFMKTAEEAETLASLMVKIGKARGRLCRGIITDMSQPLGRAVGNAIEVREAIDTLRGEGPDDLTELCLLISAHMVSLSLCIELSQARKMAEDALYSGRALELFKKWVSRQGGELSALLAEDFGKSARFSAPLIAEESGVISACLAEKVGVAAMALGAGRACKEDSIDMSAGIYLFKKEGDAVKSGDALAILYTDDKSRLEGAVAILREAYTVSEKCGAPRPLVYRVIE